MLVSRTVLLSGMLLLHAWTANLANADIIAKWTFPETSPLSYPNGGLVSAPYAANIGTGTMTAIREQNSRFSGSGAAVSSGNSNIPAVDDGTGLLRTSATNATITLDFEFSTTGYQDIILSLDAARISLDRTSDLGGSISLDGGATFVPGTGLGSSVIGFNWNHRVGNFSSIDVIENQPNLLFRMTARGVNSTIHNLVMDNFTVMGTPLSAVPEPSTGIMASMAIAIFAFRRRCRQ